ncbi:hypothetical protein MM300_21040 [Evansella sp. LMS18]|jgi:hypothetical protein|uniref:hypothetical protein n=1 Tax=Evansella sp. LMS18 TaxID=2924033 RepID=UPI0020D010A5|nr:hypothetical protein [Evansella sp. LMS18]UTR10330.1 hypothetical protein MM300_21040 [Evansella sp. LMS18]
MIWFFALLVFLIIAFAILIDWRRKRNNNIPNKMTHPEAKPGDSSNYMMGDHRPGGGGGE